MRIAVVTPLDARSTGVADYSRDLLPYLARATGDGVLVFVEDALRLQLDEGDDWKSRPVTDLPCLASGLDLIVYQMGNSPAHDFMAPFLHKFPGLVVLHDLSLHDFYIRQASRSGCPAAYLRAFGFGYGTKGTVVARDCLRQAVSVGYPEYLLGEWVAVRSPGVVVHSRHAAAVLGERCPEARIWVVPMPIPLPYPVASAEARSRLGLTADVYLIAVFGVLNLSKSPIAILDALSRLRVTGIRAQVVFIGPENSPFRLMPEVEKRGLQADVIQLGFVDDLATSCLWLSAADVAVSLRSLYWGETSASVLRVLASGTPAIVNDVGAFAELPDAACVKIASDVPDPVEALCLALEGLYQQPDQRRAMGGAARDYVAKQHDPGRVATHYVEIIETILDGW